IDQAVADGVDVINFSISGSRTNFRDSVEIAFLFAADAGVFVAVSAGNSGPASSTVAHPGPWLTTVAAGTHNRNGEGSVTLGNSVTVYGASVATAVGPAPFIDSESAGLPGADPTEVRLCASTADTAGGTPVLDPAKVAGKIVLCDRGTYARVNKSLAVAEAGGVGAVLVNNPTGSLNADFHFVPTVHVQYSDRAALKAYAATAGATATINQAAIVYNTPAPFTAGFSSRGPLLASGSLLKPDLIAPGQDILAGVAPPGNSGRLFDLYSGTSMSSPHVAGLGALMKELHPDWSPMAIKSALMTTGVDVLDGGTPPAAETNSVLIFRQGAGHVQPNSAADPGLVFDSGFNDWLNFICGTQPGSFCSAFTPINPSDLNVASIALGALPGSQTITRTVKNVSSAAETYVASVNMTGFDVTGPAAFTIAPGASHTFQVTFSRTTATLNSYRGGQLRLIGSEGHVVRVPIVARPVALAAPTQVSGSYDVTFGYTGSFTATARGLVPADVTDSSVDQDPDQTFNPADPAGTTLVRVDVPAGTTYARFALFDADVAAGSDIDLYVYRGNGTYVGGSGNGGSTEEVNDTAPVAGSYYVFMHGWGLPSGTSPFKLYAWALGSTAAGNMTVTAPASATQGATGAINLSFSDLASGTKYLGSVVYGGAAGMPSPTIVRVDN
ncbi:MAG TPA: S8 family serine peptidase, partial [Xanthomonadales bacterium]|nr:S8 family serine peptidase [Xanthomonadales bacterium]